MRNECNLKDTHKQKLERMKEAHRLEMEHLQTTKQETFWYAIYDDAVGLTLKYLSAHLSNASHQRRIAGAKQACLSKEELDQENIIEADRNHKNHVILLQKKAAGKVNNYQSEVKNCQKEIDDATKNNRVDLLIQHLEDLKTIWYGYFGGHYQLDKETMFPADKNIYFKVLQSLGALYCYRGNYKKALVILKEAYELNNKEYIVPSLLGRIHSFFNNHKEALEYFSRAVSNYTDKSAISGFYYLERGDYRRAKRNFEAVIIGSGVDSSLNPEYYYLYVLAAYKMICKADRLLQENQDDKQLREREIKYEKLIHFLMMAKLSLSDFLGNLDQGSGYAYDMSLHRNVLLLRNFLIQQLVDVKKRIHGLSENDLDEEQMAGEQNGEEQQETIEGQSRINEDDRMEGESTANTEEQREEDFDVSDRIQELLREAKEETFLVADLDENVKFTIVDLLKKYDRTTGDDSNPTEGQSEAGEEEQAKKFFKYAINYAKGIKCMVSIRQAEYYYDKSFQLAKDNDDLLLELSEFTYPVDTTKHFHLKAKLVRADKLYRNQRNQGEALKLYKKIADVNSDNTFEPNNETKYAAYLVGKIYFNKYQSAVKTSTSGGNTARYLNSAILYLEKSRSIVKETYPILVKLYRLQNKVEKSLLCSKYICSRPGFFSTEDQHRAKLLIARNQSKIGITNNPEMRFLEAVEAGSVDACFELARQYEEENRLVEAIRQYKVLIKSHDVLSDEQLGFSAWKCARLLEDQHGDLTGEYAVSYDEHKKLYTDSDGYKKSEEVTKYYSWAIQYYKNAKKDVIKTQIEEEADAYENRLSEYNYKAYHL